MKRLPPSLEKYIRHLAAAGKPLGFTEIVSVTPGYNGFRKLRDRGLIVNVIPGYSSADDPDTGPRLPQYVLTVKGWQELLKLDGCPHFTTGKDSSAEEPRSVYRNQ